MKQQLLALSGILAIVTSCSLVGRNPSPPTKLEQGIFNIQTNYVPVVVTNTGSHGEPVLQTNQQPQYTYSQGSGAQAAKDTVGAVGNLFGVGGLASTALGGLLSIWGWLRSSKNYQTAANTAQVVETLRQFVKSLPNGQAYDSALTQFMTQHQAEAGVIANVTQILEAEVSNPDAKVAADSVIATLRQLGINIPTPPQ